jgi:hypothetical protein
MGAGAVFCISGATGPNAAFINGVYDRSSETSGGYVVYSKRGDPSKCIEHFGGKWQVKPVSSKGTDECWAYVAGDCALQDCASRIWKVNDGKTWSIWRMLGGTDFSDQPSVKMATGSEAERQVSCGCMRAHGHDAPAPVSLAHARMLVCDAFCFCTGC